VRVACAYVPGMLHARTRVALEAYAPGYELYELGLHFDAYYTLLSTLWEEGEAWLNVEQDIEIHPTVVAEAASCPHRLCVWPYHGASQSEVLTGSLGCTRFSNDLLDEFPDFMRNLPVRGWKILDAEIHPRLLDLGVAPHLHYPTVKHHHVYGGECACGETHE